MSVTNLILPGGQRVCTGRIKPKARPRTLHLHNYIDADAVASLPLGVDWATNAMTAIRRFYLNDREGDCVIADVGHGIGVWAAAGIGAPILPTDAEIHAAYMKLKAGPGDSGCVISDVLDAWTANGIMLGGQVHKIEGYVAVDWRQKPLVQAAILMFGGLRLGLDLPAAWADSQDGDTWSATRTRIVGGHDVRAVKYDENGVWIATWGSMRMIPWDVLANGSQFDEAYVELSPDWINKNGTSPSGLMVSALKDDLNKLGNGTLPEIVNVGGFDFSDFA